MNIYLNQQTRTVPEGYTLAAFLSEIAPQSPFAVAINKAFVPKERYAETVLQVDDNIELVQPVVGG